MPSLEQVAKCEVNMSADNPFNLTLVGRKHNERIAIVEPEKLESNTPQAAQDLWRTVALSHLVSAHFPRTIETNFPVENTRLIDSLYNYYRLKPPKIVTGSDRLRPSHIPNEGAAPENLYVVNAHSGGLDSCFRLTKHLAQGDLVKAVHMRNLNRVLPGAEADGSRRQCDRWSVPYTEVKVINSAELKGLKVMRTRDLLIAATVVLSAYHHGIKKVLIEGGFVDVPEEGNYSESRSAWKLFNKILKEEELNLSVVGEYPGDIETIGELLKLEQKLNVPILPLIQNCFTRKCWAGNNRRKWERATPQLAKACLGENTCGSCPKCRRTVLGRIYYKDSRLEKVPHQEVAFFVKDTKQWLKRYGDESVSGNFISHLDKLDKRCASLSRH